MAEQPQRPVIRKAKGVRLCRGSVSRTAGPGPVSSGLGIRGGGRGGGEKRLQIEKGRGTYESAFEDLQGIPALLFGTEPLVVWPPAPRGSPQVLKCQLLHSLAL